MKILKIFGVILLTVFLNTSLYASIVGATKGSVDVSSGSLTYDLEIITPKGTAGLKPSLFITYDSSTIKNKSLGFGFKLSGLSSIEICAKDTNEEISDSSRDFNYCLDGQKLLHVNTTDTYGANEVEYKTEINNYSKIVSYATSGKTTHWKVFTKSGYIYEYGATLNAQAKDSSGDVKIFKRNKTSDRLGNEINYNHNEYGFIQDITYADNKINFEYENRTDTHSGYLHGSKTTYDKRVKKIVITIEQQGYQNYNFTYETNRLKKIEQCSSGECLKPIEFTWNNQTNGIFEETYSNSTTTFGPKDDTHYITSGDYNSDGKDDFIRYTNNKLYTLLSNGDGTFAEIASTTTTNFGAKNDTYSLISGDYNADGKDDFLRYTNNKLYTLLSNGDGTFTEIASTTTTNFGIKNDTYYASSGDYNGDGRDDFLRYTDNKLYTLLSNGDGTFQETYSTTTTNFGKLNDTYESLAGDFNADGLSDLLRYTNNKLYTLFSNGDGTFKEIASTTTTNFGAKNDTYSLSAGDYNGDGLSDLLRYTENKLYTLLSKGDGSFEEIYSNTNTNFGKINDTYFTTIGDYNGDNLTDFIRYTNNKLYTFISNGDGTFKEIYTNTTTDFGAKGDTYYLNSGDYNGDGLADFLRYTENKLYTLHSKDKKALITNITNNSDQDISFAYSTLQDESIYTVSSGAVYPNLDIKSASNIVVKSINTDDGVGGINSFSYMYEGYKVNHERGSLGFKKITRTNNQNGDYTITSYNQDFPFIGTIATKEKYVNDIKTIEETNTYENILHVNINNKIYHLYRPTKEIVKYDINGNFLLKSKQTKSQPDIYGNSENYKTQTFDSQDETNSFSKETISTFKTPDTQKWLVSLASSVKTIHTKPNDIANAIQTTIFYDYDENGLLAQEKVNKESKELINKYQYNSFGNITKKTISGSDIKTRSEFYEYDKQGKNLTKLSNALNQSLTNTYDYKNNLISSKDPNNLTTSYHYDSQNRKIKEVRADKVETSWNYSWDSTFANSLYSIAVTITGAPTVTTYFDNKNRKVRVKRLGFKGNSIYEDTFHDKLGRVIKKSRPYFSEELPSYTYNTYDALNRITNIKSTGPNGEDVQKNFTYDKFSTTQINAKNQYKITTNNAIGQTIKVIDELGSTIEYTYDAIGNLNKTLDSKNNAIVIQYDAFNNKSYMNDPDMGEWKYTYNVLGQLTKQTDAKGQISTMSYDLLGRLTKREEKEGETTFIYDIATNGIGKLAIEKAPEYKKEYFYDELSRLRENKEYINNKIFSTNYVYSDDGKLKSTIHPNGFIATNEYNEQGYLSGVKSPIASDINFSHEKLKTAIQTTLDKKSYAFNKLITLNTQVELYRVKALELLNLAKQYKDVDSEIEAQLLKTANLMIKTLAELSKTSIKYKEDYAFYSKELNSYLIKLINYNDEYLYKWLMETFSAQTTTLIDQALVKLNNATTSLGLINTQELLTTYKDITSYYIQEAKTIIYEAKTNFELARNYKQKYENLNEGVDKAYQGMFDDSEHKYYYKILNADEFGRITKSYTGNGLETIKEYNKANGQLNTIKTGYDGSNDIRDISYTYDILNNVTSKQDSKQNISQSYEFDELNRITKANTQIEENPTETITYQYNSIGNITHKSDVGDYSYLKAHQVESAGNINYTYDANGNVIQKDNTTITYNSNNKPISMEDTTNKTEFFYAPNRQRYKKILNNQTTYYVGKHYEFENITGATLQKNYIYAGNELVAIHIQEDDGNIVLPQNRYMHKDALGSIDTITNESGVVIQRLAYNPFGKQIVQSWINEESKNSPLVKRGYTGHEHIKEFELIHMNGRVYDPTVGRFLSADPLIQAPFESQSYNRYAYTMNNPLRYVDPSGHSWEDVSDFFGGIADTISEVVGGVVDSVKGAFSEKSEYNSIEEHLEAERKTEKQKNDYLGMMDYFNSPEYDPNPYSGKHTLSKYNDVVSLYEAGIDFGELNTGKDKNRNVFSELKTGIKTVTKVSLAAIEIWGGFALIGISGVLDSPVTGVYGAISLQFGINNMSQALFGYNPMRSTVFDITGNKYAYDTLNIAATINTIRVNNNIFTGSKVVDDVHGMERSIRQSNLTNKALGADVIGISSNFW